MKLFSSKSPEKVGLLEKKVHSNPTRTALCGGTGFRGKKGILSKVSFRSLTRSLNAPESELSRIWNRFCTARPISTQYFLRKIKFTRQKPKHYRSDPWTLGAWKLIGRVWTKIEIAEVWLYAWRAGSADHERVHKIIWLMENVKQCNDSFCKSWNALESSLWWFGMEKRKFCAESSCDEKNDSDYL